MADQPIQTGLAPSAREEFYKKIQRQRNLGNKNKAKNLTWRYRARVANNPTAQVPAGQTSPRLSRPMIQKKLERYAPGAAKKFARKQPPAPGTPGGTY